MRTRGAVTVRDVASVTIKLDSKAIKTQLSGPNGAVARDTLRRATRVQNSAKRLCPVDEGRLRASIAVELIGDGRTLEARVGTNLKYGLYVEHGTGIYAGRGYITPKRATMLRWPIKNNSGAGNRRYSGGRTAQYAFAKKVKGVRARPFLRPALDAAR
jgi:hypothetical protein